MTREDATATGQAIRDAPRQGRNDAEKGPQDGQTSAKDADVALDIDPDTRIHDRPGRIEAFELREKRDADDAGDADAMASVSTGQYTSD